MSTIPTIRKAVKIVAFDKHTFTKAEEKLTELLNDRWQVLHLTHTSDTIFILLTKELSSEPYIPIRAAERDEKDASSSGGVLSLPAVQEQFKDYQGRP